MNFWEEVRQKVLQHTTSADITVNLYKKLTDSGANELALIKPTYYLGNFSILTMDFIDYLEKFCMIPQGEWGEYLRIIFYLRENAKNLLFNVKEISEPLENLIQELEELYSGEEESEELEENEPEEPEKEIEDYRKEKKPEEEKFERESFDEDQVKLKSILKLKFQEAKISDYLVEQFSLNLTDLYTECIYLSMDLSRLTKVPEGDLASYLSIFIDLQYGLEKIKNLIMEDIIPGELSLTPGLFTWSAHFLTEILDKEALKV
ncbi:MAG: hypothetical protein HYU63_08245 [Armatimonadetes bacterium]|nr:hypothetical protein [Armatimonadota bacterium]